MKLAVLAIGGALAALGATSARAVDPAINQTFDAAVYRIFYIQPRDGGVVPSPVKFEINITGGYVVDRDLACGPAGSCYGQEPHMRMSDTGHCHTYVENMAEPGVLAGFDSRCETTFYMELDPGEYCAYADLTHNDHVARFKPGPQAFPASDKVCFRVRPGASPRRE